MPTVRPFTPTCPACAGTLRLCQAPMYFVAAVHPRWMCFNASCAVALTPVVDTSADAARSVGKECEI